MPLSLLGTSLRGVGVTQKTLINWSTGRKQVGECITCVIHSFHSKALIEHVLPAGGSPRCKKNREEALPS